MATMQAMVFERPGIPLSRRTIAIPRPGPGQVLIEVRVCGVCRTDLHIVDGELGSPKPDLVPGHEIVGTVVESGPGTGSPALGTRVGVPWLGFTCGRCEACRSGRENLCGNARFTGYTIDGGYAEYTVADARYVFPLPAEYDDRAAAPLLCAGLIGYRAYSFARDARILGIYGFGAAAHLLAQVARAEGRTVLAFTRPGDLAAQSLARSLGAAWAGGSDERPPELLDAALLFAPVGGLVPAALSVTRPGGSVICAGIHMSDIPAFPYRLLWEERTVRSVANLTRDDGERFLALAAKIPLDVHTTPFGLADADQAIAAVRAGRVDGAAVLTMPKQDRSARP